MMTTQAFPLRAAGLATIALWLSCQAHAAPLQNGDFFQALAGWTTAGDAAVVQGTVFGQNLGGASALVLGNASTWYDDDAPDAAGSYNLSGHDPIDLDPLVNLPATSVEAQLGLPIGAFGTQAYEVSTAQQSFTVQAGDVISFNWRLLSRDDGSGKVLPDAAWLVWSDGGASNTGLQVLAPGALQGGSNGWLDSGLHNVQFTATQSGVARLGWALADAGSYTGTSILAIRNVAVTPSVPEPEGLALVLTGLVLLGQAARRMHQS